VAICLNRKIKIRKKRRLKAIMTKAEMNKMMLAPMQTKMKKLKQKTEKMRKIPMTTITRSVSLFKELNSTHSNKSSCNNHNNLEI
jgi:hypothetical protein